MSRKSIQTLVLAISIFMTLEMPAIILAAPIDSTGNNVNHGLKDSARLLNFDVRPSYLFSSYKDDVLQRDLDCSEAIDSHFVTTLSLQYGFSFSDSTQTGEQYPGVYQGIGGAVSLFENNKKIGLPFSLYVFQRVPIVNLSRRLRLEYEWNFGASVGWHPVRDNKCYSNVITGSHVNAYINLGIGLSYSLNSHYSLYGGLELTHYSNGNTSFPNPGINLAGLRIGLSRYIGVASPKTPFTVDSVCESRHVSFDLVAYGAWKRRVYRGGEQPVLLKGHFPVAGISFAPMWDVKRWLRAGVSADFQWDKSTDLRHYWKSGDTTADITFGRPPFLSQVTTGIALRGEIVMPIFSVNVGIGYNIFGPEESRATYQMGNLKIHVTPSLFLNVGYQLLDFKRQNNLMLGLGYTFRSDRHKNATLRAL